jgi:hypothetical protein
MPGLMETVESQKQAFPEFPQALGNLANSARFPHSLDSRRELGKVENQQQVFHFAIATALCVRNGCPPYGRADRQHLQQVLCAPVGYIFS